MTKSKNMKSWTMKKTRHRSLDLNLDLDPGQ